MFNIGSASDAQYFTMPVGALFIDMPDPRSGEPSCHLTVMGQSNKDIDYWILGSTFMQNFYTVFDAEGSSPRIGMTLEKGSEGSIGRGPYTTIVYAIAITCVVLLSGVLIALCAIYILRKREKRRGRNLADLLGRRATIEQSSSSDGENDLEEEEELG